MTSAAGLLTAAGLSVLALLAIAGWRSARSGTGVWWPLAIAALVLGGLGSAALWLDSD